MPSMPASAAPTLTEIAVIEKDHGLLAKNQFRYMFTISDLLNASPLSGRSMNKGESVFYAVYRPNLP